MPTPFELIGFSREELQRIRDRASVLVRTRDYSRQTSSYGSVTELLLTLMHTADMLDAMIARGEAEEL